MILMIIQWSINIMYDHYHQHPSLYVGTFLISLKRRSAGGGGGGVLYMTDTTLVTVFVYVNSTEQRAKNRVLRVLEQRWKMD